MSFWQRLLLSSVWFQVIVDVLAIIALLAPMDWDLKRAILFWLLVITAVWDLGALAFLHWVPVTNPPVAPWHMTSGRVKAGIISAVSALVLTLLCVCLLLIALGMTFWLLAVIIGIALVIATIQDVATAQAVLRA